VIGILTIAQTEEGMNFCFTRCYENVRFIGVTTHKLLIFFETGCWGDRLRIIFRDSFWQADHRLALAPKIEGIRTERRSLEGEREDSIKKEEREKAKRVI